MQPSKKVYSKMVKEVSKKSPKIKDCFFAYLIGGFICVIGQLFSELYKVLGFNEDQVKMLVPITLIFLAVLLTALKVFEKIAKIAGAGTLVPITGFANAVASPSMEYKPDERDIIGLSRKAP